MEKQYGSLNELIDSELKVKEDPKTQALSDSMAGVKERGYFTRPEFLKMCRWKSPRPKLHYEKNSSDEIVEISSKVFATKHEIRRIELLDRLHGVNIPTASALLMLTDPEGYGVIDIRVWQVLYLYGAVKTKPDGKNFSSKNWYSYLMKLRSYAKKYQTKARNIERTIFLHHYKIQVGNLY